MLRKSFTKRRLRGIDGTGGDGATTSPVRIAGAIMTLSIILMDVYDHMLYKCLKALPSTRTHPELNEQPKMQ